MKKGKRIICLFLVCFLMSGLFPKAAIEAQAAVKFNVSANQMKKAINGYTVRVAVDNKEQRFIVKTSEITKLTVKSKKYSSDKKNMTVKAIAYIDRKIATVKTTATLRYSLKRNKWKISSITLGKGSISSVKLKGTWSGAYVANQGQTRARIVISEVSKDGYATGTFYFSATPTNPRVPSGSYTVVGGYDKKTGKVTFVGDEWINQPSGYSMIDFYAYLDLKNKKIRSNDYSLTLSKK